MKKIKLLLFTLFTFILISEANAQLYFGEEPTREMEIAARQAAERWEDELSLTAKETNLMEQKLLEFEVKRNALLRRNLPPEEELEQLTLLKVEETAGMRNILTKPQFDLYVSILEREASQEEAQQRGNGS